MKSAIHYFSLLLGVAILTACAVPKSMRVDSGASPKYEDESVRFRTTYYFRVVSLCEGEVDTRSNRMIETDSLYRFRMTGKAGELANKIHFESGILHKNIIDPFGTIIRYDEETGRAYVASHDDVQRESKRKMLLGEINEYLKLLDNEKLKNEEVKKAYQQLIETNLNSIKGLNPVQVNSDSDADHLPKDSKNIPKTKPTNLKANADNNSKKDEEGKCKAGSKRQAFQILGPQGMATFDQDQRLILSMSSNATPLVSMLKEMANRMMPRPATTTENLLLITQERLKLSNTERELFNLSGEVDKPGSRGMTPTAMGQKVLNVFQEVK